MSENIQVLELLARQLKSKEKDVKFCNAFALTMIARDAVLVSKKKMNNKFILRNSWSEKGYKLNPARKEDDNPVAGIFFDRWYLSDRDIKIRTRQEAWVPNRRGFATLGIDEKKIIPRKYSINNFDEMRLPYNGPKTKNGKNKPFKLIRKNGDTINYRPGRDLVPGISNIITLYKKLRVQTKSADFFEMPITEKFTQDFQKYYDEAWEKYVVKS